MVINDGNINNPQSVRLCWKLCTSARATKEVPDPIEAAPTANS